MTPARRLARMRASFAKNRSVLAEDYAFFTTPPTATPRVPTPPSKAARRSAAPSAPRSRAANGTKSSGKTSREGLAGHAQVDGLPPLGIQPEKHGLIKWAVLRRDRIGPDFRWSVQFTVDAAPAPDQKATAGRTGVVAVDLGWRVRDDGDRIIAKHKRDEERETRTPRHVVDQAKLVVLENAGAVALEWVTDTRLSHVLDKLGEGGVEVGVDRTGDVIRAMVEDVSREGAGEIADSKDVRKAIGSRAAKLFKARLQACLRDGGRP